MTGWSRADTGEQATARRWHGGGVWGAILLSARSRQWEVGLDGEGRGWKTWWDRVWARKAAEG